MCTSCRKLVLESGKEQEVVAPLDISANEFHDADSDRNFESRSADIEIVNETLSRLGDSPFIVKKLERQKRYSEEKLMRVNETIRKKLRMNSSQECTDKEELDELKKSQEELNEIIDQLIEESKKLR
eukprot:Seg1890.5 transcript_id=Seg1890.5/GoldUCD/mRNA.D3Y31 product="hypothetical protein" protein_id=Seg1890.5/GoldUCD/D3Y31